MTLYLELDELKRDTTAYRPEERRERLEGIGDEAVDDSVPLVSPI